MNFEYYLDLHKKGNLSEAEKGYRKLLKKEKNNSVLLTSLGLVCLKTDKDEEGINFLKKAIYIDNKNLIAITNLGLIYFKQKKYKISRDCLLKSLNLNKNYHTFYLLGQVYTELENFTKAIENYEQSIKINQNAEAYCNLGNLYYILGNLKEAEKFINKAITINPSMDLALNNRGLINKAKGKISNAEIDFISAIKVNKNNYMAHFNLCSINNYSKKKSYRDDLKNLLKISKNDEEKIYLNFSLGKLFERIKRYKESFDYFSKANFIKRKSFEYSVKNDLIFFKDIKKKLSINFIENNINFKKKDNSQIFIVGMPRSGTSLIEQILSSHSKVIGLGEVNYLQDVINKYFFNEKKEIDLRKINEINLDNARKDYINLINKKSLKKKFINKLPANFKWIGLIKLIFPNSKIINCERNSLDTCLSIFQQNFIIKGNEYSFNLIEIGRYYNLYLDYMKYWSNIKIDLFHNIKYENIIKEQKKEVSKLLKHCSLNWEEKCLEFYKNKRTVRTSSDLQVRKKIYSTSINKNNFYKKELLPLTNMLKSK